MKESIRVLIADDELDVIDTYQSMLILDPEREFTVRGEARSDAVLHTVEDFKPHIVLLDNWFASKEVGIEDLLPRIRGQFPQVKVIIITARRGAATDQIQQALYWQAFDFLDKQGLTPKLLREKVVKAYEEHRKAGEK